MSVYNRPTREERALRQIVNDLVREGFAQRSVLIAVAKMLAVAFGSSDETSLLFRDPQFTPAAETWDLAIKEIINANPQLQAAQNHWPPHSRSDDYPIFPESLERIRRRLHDGCDILNGENAHAEYIQAIYRLLIEFWREPVEVLTREAEAYAIECIRVRPREKVYCAYAATAGIALILASSEKLPVTLEFEGPQVLAEICAWLSVAGHLDLTIIGSDPLKRLATGISEQNDVVEINDVAFVCPPSDQKAKDSDVDKNWARANLPESTQLCGANAILSTMRARRSICFTDGTLLFHTYKVDQIFKASLLRNSNLDAILGLHASVYERNNSNHGSMLIFGSAGQRTQENAGEEARVLMVDARKVSSLWNDPIHGGHDVPDPVRIGRIIHGREETDISYLVSVDEIGEQDFNLVVDRYVYPQILSNSRRNVSAHRNTLEQVADIHRPQPLPTASRGFAETSGFISSNQEDRGLYFEVSVLDIEDAGFVRNASKKVPASAELLPRLRKCRLEPGDIIMVVKGSVGKVGYIREIPQDEIWLASQSFVIIRLRRYTAISDPLVLFRFLSSKIGQMYIKRFTVGTAVAGLQMADVRRIEILFPPRGKEEAVAREVKELFAIQDEIETLRQGLDVKRQSFWPENDTFE